MNAASRGLKRYMMDITVPNKPRMAESGDGAWCLFADIPDKSVDEYDVSRVYDISFGWSHAAFLTCPSCNGYGTADGNTCGRCYGIGLSHPNTYRIGEKHA